MGGTGVATLVRTTHHCGTETAHPKPLGLGSSALPHPPLDAVPRGARNLQRQWTTAKPRGGDVSCNVLPFFLDLSLAFAPGVEFFDAVKSSVDSEVVFQATLQVPAHHALACRLNAYGTPFAAPDLQAAAHELRDEDLEFAACLATPPDLDEQLSVNFGRVMSMLEKNQGQGGAQIATRTAPARPAAGPSAASVQQQQLQSTGNQQATAPKVLVSVDEAETTAAQLQRQSSAKKQPKLQALMDGYGKRALQAMLGLGYLLTVLHEKTLGGGRIEFSAAASIISPATSDSHHLRPRVSNGLGVLAGLRSFVRECPSLSPLSPNSSMSRRQQSAAATAAAAAAVAAVDGVQQGGGGSSSATSTPRKPHLVSSFEAAWDRVLNPPLLSSAGGSGGSSSRAGVTPRGPIPACQGLQLQLSLSAPYRRMSMEWSGGTPGSTPRSSLSPVGSYHQQQQQQQEQQQGAGAAAAAAAAGSGGVPHRGSPLAQASGGVMQAYWQQQQQVEAEQEQLHKAYEAGRGGAMEAILDSAIEQLHEQRQEASATDLVALVDADQSVFAQTAAAAAAGDAAPAPAMAGTDSAAAAAAAAAGTPSCTPIRPMPPLPPRQQQQQPVTPGSGVRSFYLADQGPLTSPMCSVWGVSAGGGVTVLPPGTPFGSPWVNVSTPKGASAAGAAAGTAAGQEGQGAAGAGGSMPGTPQRILLPVMSMRLTCQPSWQYNSSSTGTAAEGGSTVGSTGAAGGGEEKVASGDVVESSNAVAQQEQAGATVVPDDAAAAADISRPSLTLANFIAAADGTAGTTTSATTSGSSSSGSTGGSSARKAAVHMHQPTADELRSRALAKLWEQQQQQQQQQQQVRQQGVAPGGKGQEESGVGGAVDDEQEQEDGLDESALMASPISYSLPQGLWPTMSFSLVPVRFDRLPPASPKPKFAV